MRAVGKAILTALDWLFHISKLRGYAQELGGLRTALLLLLVLGWCAIFLWADIFKQWPAFCEPQGKGLVAFGHVAECLTLLTYGGVADWTYLRCLIAPWVALLWGGIFRLLWEFGRRRQRLR